MTMSTMSTNVDFDVTTIEAPTWKKTGENRAAKKGPKRWKSDCARYVMSLSTT